MIRSVWPWLVFLKDGARFAFPARLPICTRMVRFCRGPAQVAERTGKQVTDVANVIIWGNHSSSQYPDVNHGTVAGTPIREAVQDDAWLNGDFISVVQQRGAAIIKVWE